MSAQRLATALAAFFVFGLASGQAIAKTCRIDWHPEGSTLLAVYKDGKPYMNRAYVSHDDVVRLHEVLIASGECQRDLAIERCAVRRVRDGRFQIHFGARPLYRRETHASSHSADRQLHELIKAGFCQFDKSQSEPYTAGRRLKISQ